GGVPVIVVNGPDITYDVPRPGLFQKKDMWGTAGPVEGIDLLTLVQKIGKGKAFFGGAFPHLFHTLPGLGLGTVGLNGDNGNPQRPVLFIQGDDPVLVGNGIGTGVAGKNDQKALGVPVIGQGDRAAVHVFQGKVRGSVPDLVSFQYGGIPKDIDGQQPAQGKHGGR